MFRNALRDLLKLIPVFVALVGIVLPYIRSRRGDVRDNIEEKLFNLARMSALSLSEFDVLIIMFIFHLSRKYILFEFEPVPRSR